MWYPVRPYIATFFNREIPPSLNRVVVLVSPYVAWDRVLDGATAVTRWAAAVSVVAYTEEVGESVVDALLQISAVDSLRQHIPIDIWPWLNRRPHLPPVCQGREVAAQCADIVRHVRGLGDTELLTSYFLLLWSAWVFFDNSTAEQMQISIREDFGGAQLERNRKELVERLDYVLGRLDLGVEHLRLTDPVIFGLQIFAARRDYVSLRETLLEIDGKEVANAPACASS